MKKSILILIYLISQLIYPQTNKILILDEFNNSPIENAHITFKNGVNYITNENGYAFIKKSKNESFIVSHVSYKSIKTKTTSINDTIYLKTRFYNLEEIILNNQKTILVKPNFGLKNFNPSNYGTGSPLKEDIIYALFIPNKFGKEFYIKKISLEPTDYKILNTKGKVIEEKKNHKFAPFKIDVFSVDSVYNIPKYSIINKPIAIKLEDGEKFSTATFDEKIKVDKFGFFIIISSFEKSYYEKIGFSSAPSLKIKEANNEIQYLMLTKNNKIKNSLWNQDIKNKDYNYIFNFKLEIEN